MQSGFSGTTCLLFVFIICLCWEELQEFINLNDSHRPHYEPIQVRWEVMNWSPTNFLQTEEDIRMRGETFLPYKEKNPAAITQPLDSKLNIYVDNSQEQTCQAEYIQRSL